MLPKDYFLQGNLFFLGNAFQSRSLQLNKWINILWLFSQTTLADSSLEINVLVNLQWLLKIPMPKWHRVLIDPHKCGCSFCWRGFLLSLCFHVFSPPLPLGTPLFYLFTVFMCVCQINTYITPNLNLSKWAENFFLWLV